MAIPVYLFAANLIGYFRVITGILAVYYAYDKPMY